MSWLEVELKDDDCFQTKTEPTFRAYLIAHVQQTVENIFSNCFLLKHVDGGKTRKSCERFLQNSYENNEKQIETSL